MRGERGDLADLLVFRAVSLRVAHIRLGHSPPNERRTTSKARLFLDHLRNDGLGEFGKCRNHAIGRRIFKAQ